MAKRNYYAVRKGTVTGIFESWADCQSAVSGYSGAEFKGFSTLEEAQNYLNPDGTVGEPIHLPPSPAYTEDKNQPESQDEIQPEPGRVIAYVDGSFDAKLNKYSFGCVFLTPAGAVIEKYGNGDNPESLAIRNVAGEMLGAMYAVRWAMVNGYSEIEIRYDYEGIKKWAVGEWRAKNELTQKYASAMNRWGRSIRISFLKITAHSNNKYNDMADKLAKIGLREGNGIPPICREEQTEEESNEV